MIYEPLYLPGQQLVDDAFAPLLVTDNSRSAWREFAILVDLHRRGVHRMDAVTGLFSPRFREKTGITGRDFLAFAEAHPGADVYIVNPFPHIAYLSFNVWTQGEMGHPGITRIAQSLLEAVGIPWTLKDVARHGPGLMCYCNFWMGTARFWDEYVGGVLGPIARFLEENADSDVARAVMQPTRYFEPAPFLPFIIERLFSTYLSLNPVSVRAYELDPVATCINEFERDSLFFLRKRIDHADRTGDFPEDLKQWLRFLHQLRRRYTVALYTSVPLPATGRVLSPDDVARAERGFSMENAR